MIIDNKGKLFGKISIIDIMVVFVIIAILLGVGYKFSKSSSVVLRKTESITLEFFAAEAPEFAADAAKIGDTVSDLEKMSVFGKVTALKVDKAKSFGQTASGELVPASRPGFSSIKLEVAGEVMKNIDGGFSVNNATYVIGKEIQLKVGNTGFMARIYSIK